TITNSCMVTSRNSAIINRSATFAKPGVLKKENGKWTLYEAERYRVLTNSSEKSNYQRYKQNDDGTIDVNDKKIKNGSEVSFQYSLGGKPNLNLGYVTKILSDDRKQNSEIGKSAKGFLLMIPPSGSRKKYDSIMVSNGNKVDCNGLNLPVDTIEEIWKSYRYNVKKNEELAHSYENLMFKPNENGTPIWYEIDKNKNVHFSIAQCGRQIMKNKMYDILGDFAPCHGKELCPACKLFGTVNTENTRAGKVRFSDAVIDNAGGCKQKTITLEELASPHITATEFYMQPPQNLKKAWNYDFYLGNANGPKTLINGRKFYWHFTPKESNAPKTIRNATMDAVLSEQKFTFKVYYNDVTDSELETLKTALTLGENETSSRLCHKLGHGKPLGYGSAKLTI
ncbi:MAG: RAMP superfamily CRISPR-associated protein, partial [Oscillospiraceae bacterium]